MDMLLVVLLSAGSVIGVAYIMYRALKGPVMSVVNFFRSIADRFR